MSQNNVEAVRRAWELFITRGLEAHRLPDFWTDDCVFEDFPAG
jgi:hypothetical protein